MRRVAVPKEMMPEKPGVRVVLPAGGAHHLRDVLRMETGDRVELFDGQGAAWVCEISDLGDEVVVEAVRRRERSTESELEVTILQAIPKGDRWDWFLEKATELGVSRIVPVETKRTVVSVPAKKIERKLERWARIVENAARQSKRTKIPVLERPTEFGATLETTRADARLFAHPDLDVIEQPESITSVAIWIGPEGGFTESEVEQLLDSGALPFGLGPRVLRSETAGIFAAGLAQARWGDLR